MPVNHLHVFFGKMSIQIFCKFFLFGLFGFLILSCISCWCVLDINPLSYASFANILSLFIGCLFVLSVVSFAVQKLLNLIRSSLLFFAFIYFALEDWSKKLFLRFMSKTGLPIFSSRSFMVSCL